MPEENGEHTIPTFMELVEKRSGVLERLAEEAAHKRDLVEELDCSRSTIDRAIRELVGEELVACEDGRYRTTAAGAVACHAHRQFARLANDIGGARDLLGQLTADEPLDPMLLRDAEVARASELTRVELLEPIQCRLREADAIAVVLPELADIGHLDIYRQRAETGVQTDIVLDPELYATLRVQRPRTLRQLGSADGATCHVAETPPCGLIVTEQNGEATATVLLFNDGQIIGTITNDTSSVLAWANRNIADLREVGRDVTEEMSELSTASVDSSQATGTGGHRTRLPNPVRADGFTRLSSADFDRREPVDPATAYRTGLGFTEIAAGYAADRTTGDTAQCVATRLLDRLAEGNSTVVIGSPGVGKSTVCKQVAYQWYEADRGPVLYRSGDTGRRINHPEELLELARTVEGHTLVVVEAATHPDARPALDLARTIEDESDISVLFDARRGEWDTVEAGDEIELFHLPEIDEADCARLIETVRSLGATQELPPASELLAAGREAAHEAAVDAGVTLSVVHRLATLLDPLATDRERQATPLVADVEAAIDATLAADSAVFDIALAVQACIVSDQPVSVDLLYGLHRDPQTVDTAIELLTDRALFPPVADGVYRTVHASWAAMFIERAVERRGAATISDRLLERLERLFRLADDAAARDRLRTLVSGSTPLVRRVKTDPQRWVDDCVERFHRAPIEYPKIAPAFNSDDGLPLPEVASEGIALLGRFRRAQAAERGGAFDRALSEVEVVREQLANEATVPPGHTRTELEIRADHLAGRIHRNQGDLATAEDLLNATLTAAEETDQDTLAGRCRYELGDIARQRGHLDEARELFQVCAEHANSQIRTDGLRGLGRVEHTQGNYEKAAERLKKCLAIDNRLGDRNGLLQTLNVLGANAVVRGETETAEEHFRRSIEIARRLGARKAEAEALNNLGEVFSRRGANEAAREHYERARAVASEVGVSRSVAIALCNLGHTQCVQGERSAAKDSFQQALSIGERLESPKLQLHAHRGLAAVAGETGDHGVAVDQFDRAHALASEMSNERMAATIRADQATAIAARGDRQRALSQLEAAIDALHSVDALVDVLDSIEELVDICLDAADRESAVAACHHGIDVATRADLDDRVTAFKCQLAEIDTGSQVDSKPE